MMIYTFDQIYESCVIGVKKRSFNADEIKLNAFLRANHNYYRIYANYGLLHLYIDKAEDMGWNKEYLLHLYNQRLSKNGTTAREYYNLLKSYSADNKCTLCHISEADSLDHFLPKELFPSLTISPNNLIPSCDKCNKKKLEYFTSQKDAQLIHPRFEGYYNSFWLLARFDEKQNRIIIFPNKNIYHENSIEYQRILKHIDRLGLTTVYEANAMRKVREIVRATTINSNLTLKEAVTKEIETLQANFEEYMEAKFTFDIWKWITCMALLQSDYFLANGTKIFSSQPVITKPSYKFR
ncbi:HNH endonuclease [Kosakonia sp. MUSA4]|uniref:HNH endonuclease n=1 Tax=Kosakonia sp. MUSA4 TaxID=2067958 RepID=UPI001599A8B0|nr:HNH endonuclease [Kosakonia sp. MUSA4]QJT80832.1 HNH endonuclease [Kosakonia sp. MUSA4]